MPKVSIIVPVYNVEKFLDRCVNSLINQTLKDIEIILVDDGSPDHCPQMCDRYREQDERIKVVHKKNGGLGYARNSGMEAATGEYVGFVDSDDYVERDMFEALYQAAIGNGADIVRADHYREDRAGNILDADKPYPLPEGRYDKKRMTEEIMLPQVGLLPGDGGNKYISCSVWRNIYRSSIIQSHKLRFESERDFISEDMLFNLDFLYFADSCYVMNRKFYHYMINETSLTQSYKKDRFDKELVFYHELEKRLREKGLYADSALRLQRHLFTRARLCIKGEFYGNPQNAYAGAREILSCEELKKIYKTYPEKQLPVKYRVVFILMKYRMAHTLQLLKKYL